MQKGCDSEPKVGAMTATPQSRYGMTVPFGGPLHAQRERFQALEAAGYTDLWSAEAMGEDGLTPLALASVWTPSMRLGTAILPVYTRGPALMAQSIAAMASAAPGRFVAGLGTSSNVIVERWNGIPFEDPYKRMRDTVRFLRAALSGEKVTEEYDTFTINGFRLGVKLDEQVPILIAALREGMLRLAGREGDGAIVNWLSVADTETVTAIVREENAHAEVAARLFVAPSEDREMVLASGKFAMAAYLNVPVYKAFHEWMGRTDQLGEHWQQWADGDRKGALEKIPDAVVDDLIISGNADECRAHVQRYVDAGITCPVLSVMPFGDTNIDEAIRDLAPSWA
jgi:probable F420-dependent oxidoreductase